MSDARGCLSGGSTIPLIMVDLELHLFFKNRIAHAVTEEPSLRTLKGEWDAR